MVKTRQTGRAPLKKKIADPPKSELTELYQPTAAEFQAVAEISKRAATRPPAPKLKSIQGDEGLRVTHTHTDDETGWFLLQNALGSTNPDFTHGLITQLINAGTQGKDDGCAGANFMLSVIRGIQPNDEAETMIAAQMAAVHMATMTFARRLAHVETIAQQDSAANSFNKLARTFAVQLEALKRYRTGGEQKVTVQHVVVNDGGQAIVGSVSAAPAGGPGVFKKEAPTP